jgi:TonB family protein
MFNSQTRAGALICGIAVLLPSCVWSAPGPPPPLPILGGVGIRSSPLKIIHMVKPKIPAAAKRAGIKGPVILEIKVDEKGNVSVLRTIYGHPLLNRAAASAVQQWKYEPVLLDGHPIATVSTVVVGF